MITQEYTQTLFEAIKKETRFDKMKLELKHDQGFNATTPAYDLSVEGRFAMIKFEEESELTFILRAQDDEHDDATRFLFQQFVENLGYEYDAQAALVCTFLIGLAYIDIARRYGSTGYHEQARRLFNLADSISGVAVKGLYEEELEALSKSPDVSPRYEFGVMRRERFVFTNFIPVYKTLIAQGLINEAVKGSEPDGSEKESK